MPFELAPPSPESANVSREEIAIGSRWGKSTYWGNDVLVKGQFRSHCYKTLNDVLEAWRHDVGGRGAGRERHVLVHKDFIIDNNFVSPPGRSTPRPLAA